MYTHGRIKRFLSYSSGRSVEATGAAAVVVEKNKKPEPPHWLPAEVDALPAALPCSDGIYHQTNCALLLDTLVERCTPCSSAHPMDHVTHAYPRSRNKLTAS